MTLWNVKIGVATVTFSDAIFENKLDISAGETIFIQFLLKPLKLLQNKKNKKEEEEDQAAFQSSNRAKNNSLQLAKIDEEVVV